MKVLLIDDHHIFHWWWMRGNDQRFSFLNAYTIQQAQELFSAHSDLAAIVVDANMDGPSGIGKVSPKVWGFNTHDLIGEISQKFRGPIIAAPGQWWHCHLMCKAGCTHHCWKWSVASLLRKLLTS